MYTIHTLSMHSVGHANMLTCIQKNGIHMVMKPDTSGFMIKCPVVYVLTVPTYVHVNDSTNPHDTYAQFHGNNSEHGEGRSNANEGR